MCFRLDLYFTLFTEKFQAISGPWPDLVREITKEYYLGKDGLSVNIDLIKSRARDFQNLAHTLFCIDQLPEFVQGTTMQVEKWLAQTAGPSEATKVKIHDTFRIFRDLAKDRQLKAPFKKPLRVAPVEFVMIGVLIATHKETLSLPQLSEAIGLLRTETRNVHEDVRGNAKVFKTMYNVISKKVKAMASKNTPGTTVDTSSKPGKRKRDVDSDEESSDDGDGGDDMEYRPKSAKTRVPPSQTTAQSKLPTPATNHENEVPSSSHIKIEEARPVCILKLLAVWGADLILCRKCSTIFLQGLSLLDLVLLPLDQDDLPGFKKPKPKQLTLSMVLHLANLPPLLLLFHPIQHHLCTFHYLPTQDNSPQMIPSHPLKLP